MIAFLPKLIYVDDQFIDQRDREDALAKYKDDVTRMEQREANHKTYEVEVDPDLLDAKIEVTHEVFAYIFDNFPDCD